MICIDFFIFDKAAVTRRAQGTPSEKSREVDIIVQGSSPANRNTYHICRFLIAQVVRDIRDAQDVQDVQDVRDVRDVECGYRATLIAESPYLEALRKKKLNRHLIILYSSVHVVFERLLKIRTR